ncbi:AzlC family ABC transporter permease [Methanocaldococcus sp. 16A]
MFKRGLIRSFPIAIGYLPVAITFGVSALALGFSKVEVFLISALIFAGASQFALISLLPYSVIDAVSVALILNLRHIIYSYIISQKFELKKPFITAFGLTDEVFASSIASEEMDEKYILGLEVGSYLSWILGTLVGIFGGYILLSNEILYPSLLFSLTALYFILLVPNLKKLGLSAILGGVIALVFYYFGYPSIGILVAGILSPLVVLKIKNKNGIT